MVNQTAQQKCSLGAESATVDVRANLSFQGSTCFQNRDWYTEYNADLYWRASAAALLFATDRKQQGLQQDTAFAPATTAFGKCTALLSCRPASTWAATKKLPGQLCARLLHCVLRESKALRCFPHACPHKSILAVDLEPAQHPSLQDVKLERDSKGRERLAYKKDGWKYWKFDGHRVHYLQAGAGPTTSAAACCEHCDWFSTAYMHNMDAPACLQLDDKYYLQLGAQFA